MHPGQHREMGHGQIQENSFSWTMMAAALTGAPQPQPQQQHQQQRGIAPPAAMTASGGVNTYSTPSPPELFQGVMLRGLPFSATREDVKAFLVSVDFRAVRAPEEGSERLTTLETFFLFLRKKGPAFFRSRRS